MKKVFFALMMVASSSAFAEVSIDCGKGLNKSDYTLKQREFMVSTEGYSFKGKSGKEWFFTDAQGKDVKGVTASENQAGDVVLIRAMGKDIGGTVGTKYTIKNFSSGELTTTATQEEVGGFAGGNVTDNFDCVISEM